MILTKENYTFYAMRNYNNSCVNSIEEFQSDLNRIECMKRIFGKYTNTGKINVRLTINHFIILTNVFGKFAVDLIYLLISGYPLCVNSLLLSMSYLDLEKNVEFDVELYRLIKEEIR